MIFHELIPLPTPEPEPTLTIDQDGTTVPLGSTSPIPTDDLDES